jgi:hypothetical protein
VIPSEDARFRPKLTVERFRNKSEWCPACSKFHLLGQYVTVKTGIHNSARAPLAECERLMQIIRAMPVSVGEYANLNLQRTIKPPRQCPRCAGERAFQSLGYYSRNATNTQHGILRTFVRRFRCCRCYSTVSVLPSFAQPYRLVLNQTIGELFNGTLEPVINFCEREIVA